MTESTIQIRKFSSLEEIENLSGFHADNPVNVETYRQLLGHYELKNEIKCCRKTKKGLCHTPHKFGFVVELNDSSVTIVGNVCAEERFGIDTDIAKHAKAYHQEQARQKKLERLNELLTNENIDMQYLASMLEELEANEKKLAQFIERLPSRVLDNLRMRAKTRDTQVQVASITHHRHVDEDGHVDHETRKQPNTLGILKGLSVLDGHSCFGIKQAISDIKNAYKEAHNLAEDAKSAELEAINARIAELPKVSARLDTYKKEIDNFFTIEPLLFCYLVNEKSDRYKMAKVSLELIGKVVGRDKAKGWLIERDQELKDRFGADGISI